MKESTKGKSYNFFKFILLAIISLSCFYVSFAFAADVSDFGGMASTLTSNLPGLAKLITGASFLAGFAFAFASIMKFKQHKDNPTQIPIGTPIAMLFIAVALLFMPSLFKAAGTSMGMSSAGSISGMESF